MHLGIDLAQSALDQAVHDRVLDQSFSSDVVQHQSSHFTVLRDLVAQLFPCLRQHESVSPCQLFADIDALILLSSEHKDAGGSFGSVSLDLELEQPSYVLEYVFPASD